MSERFELFRLSLLKRVQMSMFGNPEETREACLRAAFGQRLKFTFYSTDFHFVPESEQSDADIIMARIGRPVEVEENRPPDEGLADIIHAGWKAFRCRHRPPTSQGWSKNRGRG